MDLTKIFCIGFHKTGTTSLASALEHLGYKVIHGDPRNANFHKGTEGRQLLNDFILKGDYHLPTFEIYDAFADNPYFSIWREILKLYPEAKFVLTIRDEKEWIESCVKYYKGRRMRPMREWMFGEYADPSKNIKSKNKWLEKYNDHNNSIINEFHKQNKDLLMIDITQNDRNWEKLCDYLDKPKPNTPFPHKKNNNRLNNILKKIKNKIS